jgi:CHRD domain-containing protein
MRKVAILVFVTLGVLGVGAVATADDDDGSGPNSARLNGYQEPPSISTRGTGSFHIKFNKNNTADYVLSYRDVETPVSQAHIHLGQRSVNGGIAVFLCRTPPQPGPAPPAQNPPVCPPMSGTVTGTIGPNDIIGPNGQGLEPMNWEEFEAAVKVGHTYANVHSSRFPGGEIRGQINDRDQREYTGPPLFAD